MCGIKFGAVAMEKIGIFLRISYIFSTFAGKLTNDESRISNVGKNLQRFGECSC